MAATTCWKCARLSLSGSRLLGKSKRLPTTTIEFRRFKSRIWQIARSLKVENQPAQSDVCFLSDLKPRTHEFKQAFTALQAYAIEGDEVAVLQLNIRDKTRSESIRGNVLLPHPFGDKKIILVFAEGDLAKEATDAGADYVGGEELLMKVENKELQFDYCLSSLDFLDNLKHLPRILKEKMPHPRRGTATDDLGTAISTFKQGYTYKCRRDGVLKLELGMPRFGNLIRNDSKGILSTLYELNDARLSFIPNEIQSNLSVLIRSVLSNRVDMKVPLVESIFLTSTFGPGYRLKTDDIMSSR